MTHALVCVNETTYGGVYYCSNFTISGAQPVWTKLTVTGLPNLRCNFFGVDKNDPVNKQYVACLNPAEPNDELVGIYFRNGGNWTEILNLADAKVIAGTADAYYKMWWMYVDPTVSGTVYTCLWVDIGLTDNLYILKSTDYGANWTAHVPFANSRGVASVCGNGNNIWVMAGLGTLRNPWLAYSEDGGTTWAAFKDQLTASAGSANGNMDPYNRDQLYHSIYNGNVSDMIASVYSAGVITSGIIDVGTLLIAPAGNHLFESSGRQVALSTGNNNFYTDNDWASYTVVNTGTSNWRCAIRSQNSSSTVIGRGASTSGRMWVLDDETDTTYTDRSGANAGAAPYTDSLPGTTGVVAWFGVWFGELPSSVGVFVFSVEMEDGDNTWDDSLFSYDALGSPMGGDRSSFRDMYADGFDVYHAEDVHADTPQIHAPWPAANGEAPVSDGTKYVPTDIITQAEFDYSFYLPSGHCPVTLDADAALILDLQGSCSPAQEIGLDTQQPTYVWMGPSFAPADEPTFQPMYIEQLANVVTTAPIGDGEVLMFDGALGQWVNAENEPALSDLHEHIINEDHTADCNGVAVNFSTAYVFRPLSTQVYLNGLRQRLGPSFYLEDGDYNGITFDTAPEDDDMLWMDYIVEYIDYLAALSDSDNVDLTDSEDVALEDSS